MKKYIIIFYSISFVFISSCTRNEKITIEKNNNRNLVKSCKNIDSILRSEIKLFDYDGENIEDEIKKLSNEYPYFFKDTLKFFFRDIARDLNYNIIYDSVFVKLNKLDNIYDDVYNGFCILKKYFSEFQPRLVTMIDDDIIDTFSPPFNPIAFDKINNIILIQLQWFLGKDHVFYSNRPQPIPEYLTQRYQSKYIAPMIFQSISNSYMKQNNKEDLLSAIINKAKPYLFSEIMLPHLSDSIIFGASKNDIDFFNKNANMVWKYILENEYLFSGESSLKQQFITPSSSNHLGTPGRFGVWIGWQILRSYYNNNNKSLEEVLGETNYLKLLNESNYKP